MEWLLLVLVPVALLMLAVQLLPIAYLPDAARRFRKDWKGSSAVVRGMIVLGISLGIALAVALLTGGGEWLAFALLGYVAVPVVWGALLPFVALAQHRRRSRRQQRKPRRSGGWRR